jgi:predicted pyridoxine 5'-phosphate oxidase superfamily flavin-nucleotide-binding protein
MAKIPKEVREFFEGKTAWVATASHDGVPNTTPKGTVRVIDDEHVVFADLFSVKTRANLKENPWVAVTAIDANSYQGYQIKGKSQMFTEGPLFDEMKAALAKAPTPMPPLNYVVLITVDSIYDQSVGPKAGQQIV